MHSAHTARAEELIWSGQGALGQGPGPASPDADAHDGVLEVEDAGLEGGQEGVAQPDAHADAAVLVKQENSSVGDHQKQPAAAGEQEAGPSGQAAEDTWASVAIFGQEIAADEHKPDQQDLAGTQPGTDRLSEPPDDSSKPHQTTAQTAANDQQEEEPASSHQGGLDPSGLEAAVQPSNEDIAPGNIQNPMPEPDQANQQAPPVQTFIVLCREKGEMQIFALPEMQLLFSYNNVVEGPPLLTQGGSSPSPSGKAEEEEGQVQVVEACMASFGASYVSGQTC